MHFTDDVVAPLTAEAITCGHPRAELIPELMMGRSRAGHLNFASLGLFLPAQLSDCESVAEGGRRT